MALQHNASVVVKDWDYAGNGPGAWARLNPDWAVAAHGRQQSPIDLPCKRLPEHGNSDNKAEDEGRGPEQDGSDSDSGVSATSANDQLRLQITSLPALATSVNTGQTIMVESPGASMVSLAGRKYRLLQFHFHGPSEHTFGGVRHKLELHLVHTALEGQGPGPALAVIGVLFEIGEPSEFLQYAFSAVPTKPGAVVALPGLMRVDQLNLSGPIFHYAGSLTTPPCSEGVAWCVLRKTQTLSRKQLEAYKAVVPFDNYRPVQPLNGRTVHTCSCDQVSKPNQSRPSQDKSQASRTKPATRRRVLPKQPLSM